MRSAHPDDPPEVCGVCGKGYSSVAVLNGHMEAEHSSSAPAYDCDQCGKAFRRKENLVQHRLIHDGPRFRCPHCPKEFVQRSNLVRHVRTHLGIKRFSCGVCGRRFTCSRSLRTHEMAHRGEKFVSYPVSAHLQFSGRHCDPRFFPEMRPLRQDLLLASEAADPHPAPHRRGGPRLPALPWQVSIRLSRWSTWIYNSLQLQAVSSPLPTT